MAAKVLVVTLVTTGLGPVAAGGSFRLTQAILSGRDTGLSIGDVGVVPALLASALVAPVAALVGMAIGALVRASAATMGVSFAVLLLVPMAVSDDHYGTAVVDHLLPYSAWARLVEVVEKPAHFPWSEGGARVVYAAWGLVPAVITVVAAQRRGQYPVIFFAVLQEGRWPPGPAWLSPPVERDAPSPGREQRRRDASGRARVLCVMPCGCLW
ncbi:hypothetical protein ACIRFH_33945 [Streptomyces sp. NPDC093586]|uniref:hypothetical protein n=1 Tax=Streptomyces sp. NPDC093586 TaxID=3366042 RepID=UPI003808BC7E